MFLQKIVSLQRISFYVVLMRWGLIFDSICSLLRRSDDYRYCKKRNGTICTVFTRAPFSAMKLGVLFSTALNHQMCDNHMHRNKLFVQTLDLYSITNQGDQCMQWDILE